MRFATASKLVSLTREIYPSSKNDDDNTIDVWMGLFGNKDDGLMETAIRLCFLKCKFWPTPAEINEAIKDLQYEEQTKPKQLPWEVQRDVSVSKKAFDMVSEGKSKDYMQGIDISKLHEYAKYYFPDISQELVRKNYNALFDGKQCQDMCFACKVDKNACLTQGWVVKHRLDESGWIYNEMAKCQKK